MIVLNDSLPDTPYTDLVPFREMSVEESSREHRRGEVERARTAATDAIILAATHVVRVLEEALIDDDAQVRLRACEILLSRSIAKVAAKHANLSDDEVIDTVDVQALRSSILAEIQKRR